MSNRANSVDGSTVVTIAALITCHNRKDLTLSCLRSLQSQEFPANVCLDIYLVDDGSTDGTSTAVRSEFPDVRVIAGDGALFWGGGMRLAFGKALEVGYTYYLWINDDNDLDRDAISRALDFAGDSAADYDKSPIVVGVFEDSAGARTTYGGWKARSRILPARLRLVEDHSKSYACDTANGNFVLIPSAVPQAIGNIDSRMIHTMGDFDFLFRARKAGFPVLTLPGLAGKCDTNVGHLDHAFARKSIFEAWRYFISTKCLPPGQWATFHFRHGGLLWPVTFLSPYLRFWFLAFSQIAGRGYGARASADRSR